MKKYRPIRIFSIRFGYGWWWGKYFFFIGKHSTAFAIMPMSFHHRQCEYMNWLRQLPPQPVKHHHTSNDKERKKIGKAP